MRMRIVSQEFSEERVRKSVFRILKKNDVGRTYQFYRFLVSKLKILDESEFGDAIFVIAAVRRVRDQD